MTRKNIYLADISVVGGLDAYLRKCFLNHLIVYNHSLEILINNPDIKFKDLKLKCYEYITEKNITEFMGSPLFNELYYQYRKFTQKNIKAGKTLTGIHYITFLVTGYNNKCFTKEDNKLFITGTDGYIELDKDLPKLDDENKMLYFNISYSNNESKYKLSIFQ